MTRRLDHGLCHLALKTRDLRVTERFYVDVLGLETAFRHPGMVFLRTPGGSDLLNFVETRRRVDARRGGLDHFGLHLPPARWRAIRARLRRARVRIAGRRGRGPSTSATRTAIWSSSTLTEGRHQLRPEALLAAEGRPEPAKNRDELALLWGGNANLLERPDEVFG
jgi:catechol 2,3-dioxygenase-like lactoylglutathione lyase family enzyme